MQLPPLRYWELVQQLTQSFWRQWSQDYLHSLQQRNKWQSPNHNFEIGDLVLVKHGNLPTYKWPLGRIQQIHPGQDGKIRVVTVKMATGVYKRPIVDLAYILIS